jgi:hypothetical protein
MRRIKIIKFSSLIMGSSVVGNLLLCCLAGRHGIEAELPKPKNRQPFSWDRDAYWNALEKKFLKIRQEDCGDNDENIFMRLDNLNKHLAKIDGVKLGPGAVEFRDLEHMMFDVTPWISACNKGLNEYLALAGKMRAVVKRQSENWDMKSNTARKTLYQLLYGTRSAIEELMIQAPPGSVSGLIRETDEPSVTPSTVVQNVRLHSGDILISRGGAPTSALIARGNDFPGNFSHIALVYIDPTSRKASIVEALIEKGLVISTVEQYLENKKLRIMLLRPRADLPQIVENPMLPHSAAEYAYKRAASDHVPYDFSMNYMDHSKLFCSEVISEAYERYGVNLWAGISYISSPGLRSWLASLGVKYFETQEPSDFEYDPQLRVVVEWRDSTALKKARFDNAVTEVMLEGAEKGDKIEYQWYLLPFSYLLKFSSVMLNLTGGRGIVPEGMSAITALRIREYKRKHKAIGERLAVRAGHFRKKFGYEAPYWKLMELARAAKEEG